MGELTFTAVLSACPEYSRTGSLDSDIEFDILTAGLARQPY